MWKITQFSTNSEGRVQKKFIKFNTWVGWWLRNFQGEKTSTFVPNELKSPKKHVVHVFFCFFPKGRVKK